MNITVILNAAYQLLGVDDITLVSNNRVSEKIRFKESLCVGGPLNSAYTIKVESLGGEGFYLSSAGGLVIPFNIWFYPDIATQQADYLENAIHSQQYTVRSSIQACNERDSSAIELVIDGSSSTRPVGVYSGTLVLTVAAI